MRSLLSAGDGIAWRLSVVAVIAIMFGQPLASCAQEEGETYVVQAGDTLWNLAVRFLGDGGRSAEIVSATNATHGIDETYAAIVDESRIVSGMKLWIPSGRVALPFAADEAVAEPGVAPVPAPSVGGHIAFSFWNGSSERCTYEINVIDVAACLRGPEACQSNRRIFAVNAVSEPALSADGRRLAYRSWGGAASKDSPYAGCAPAQEARHLATSTLDGTDTRIIGYFLEDAHPDWSPDGQRLLFDSQRVTDRVWRIFSMGADGIGESDLRMAGQQPSWAPDNNRLVYRGCDLTGNRCGLWVGAAVAAQPWESGSNMLYPVVEDQMAAHPDWSPVADQVVYQTSFGGNWDLAIVDASAVGSEGNSGPRVLTHTATVEGLPVWSPDGRWIAFLSDEGGNWGIWIIKPDGTGRQKLFAYDGGTYVLPSGAEPYGVRDWLDEQISWSN